MSKVLIVDDDKAIREMLTEHLEAAGYEVGTCKDGKAALEELDRTEYQLVLLDILIPHVNGFAVVEELSQDPKSRKSQRFSSPDSTKAVSRVLRLPSTLKLSVF